MASKPKVNTNCVADRYAGTAEKIVEISSPGGGCLISLQLRNVPNGGGHTLHVNVYNADETVSVTTPAHPTVRPR
jgi:hypothetical protein